MPELVLNNVQETIERTVYHSIRNICVELGFTPDTSDFPETQQGYSDYLAEFKNISNDKGFSIEVFSAGPPSQRELKQVPRIVLETQGFNKGNIGGDVGFQYEITEDQQSYNKYRGFDTTSDFYFNIWLVSASITQSRVLNAIIPAALPRRNYLPIYENPDSRVFMEHLAYSKSFDPIAPGLIENIDRYVCRDLIEIKRYAIVPDIPKLLEYDFEIQTT